jgi:hypothetical protein
MVGVRDQKVRKEIKATCFEFDRGADRRCGRHQQLDNVGRASNGQRNKAVLLGEGKSGGGSGHSRSKGARIGGRSVKDWSHVTVISVHEVS